MTETQRIQVGSIVLARRKTGGCDVGDIGVCYEVYSLAGRPGYSFIFQSGRYDGFSPDDVAMLLMVTCSGAKTSDTMLKNIGKCRLTISKNKISPVLTIGKNEPRLK